MKFLRKTGLIFLLPLIAFCSVAAAAELAEFEIVIQNHRFEPSTLEIPAEQKVKLIVRNLDAMPEEFESYKLRREKIIPGKSKTVIYVGPLKPGEYRFFGEFSPETAQGMLIAR